MTLICDGENTVIKNVADFDVGQTLQCGQVFRFSPISDGVYEIIAGNRRTRLSCSDGEVVFYGTGPDDVSGFWASYFDLERDYATIKASFSGDGVMSAASEYGWGIRILRQDMWETLVSFIISQNNNIPRIQKIIGALCREYGGRYGGESDGYHAFPTPEELRGADLSPIRCGFREKYIKDAVEKTLSGEVDLVRAASGTYQDGIDELKKIKGVGDKVANCVMLFGGHHLSAFPVDVWVAKALREFYGDKADPAMFGEYSGIAQQYLFYYAREHKIG